MVFEAAAAVLGGQEDAVSTNWQSLAIHRITLLLSQLTIA